MGVSTELAKTTSAVGIANVTATLLDRVGPDRITLMLMKASAAAKYIGMTDETTRVSGSIRSLLVNPKQEDG